VERHHHRNPGLTAPGIPDPGDLIVGLGRLAFTDPQWTPARIRHSPPRDPAKLAPGPAQFTAVVSAVHHAVSAVVSIAATDRRAVDVAVRASRLHVPTRTLPDGYDVPRKFASALPSTTAALLAAYQAAAAASDLAVAGLDRLAVTVGAPSRILGPRPGSRPARPGHHRGAHGRRERNERAGRERNAQAGRERNAHAGRGTGQGGYGASA